MTVALVGNTASTCDTASDFSTLNSGANINATDDDFVQGTGAVGDKMSSTTEVLASDTLLGGASGVYNFSSGGTHEGWHFIGWANVKTPFNATTGISVYFGNASAHNGQWNSIPTQFYKGGFVLRVQDPTRDFNAASTWTTTGNPAQLDDVSRMGFQFTTTSSIMGSFNNTQVDIFTVGLGLKVTDGTGSVPITFEDVRAYDEDTNFHGWWSSFAGQFVGRGKLIIGPNSGTSPCHFVDSSFGVVFADETVAADFYEIQVQGANTDVSFTLGSIVAGNPTNSRWTLTLTGSACSAAGYEFRDTSGVWSGGRIMTLNPYATLDGTALIDCTQLIQNSANLNSITVRNANTAPNIAFLEANNLSKIVDGDFEFSTRGGHAIELTTAGTYSSVGNRFTGFGADASPNAAIFNNSGGAVTINVSGGGLAGEHTVRNGTGASTTVVATVDVDIHVQDSSLQPIENAQVWVGRSPPTKYKPGTGNAAGASTIVLNGAAAIEADIPQESWAVVFDRSLNKTLPYRFASHDSANTLTLRTEVTGSATSNTNPADSTSLISTSTNFLTADVVEGDTIRNTTDGSFAVIDEIVDADNITTSPLSGGTDNLWETSDAFSVHRLATALVANDAIDIPFFNEQTSASGDITTFGYNQSQAPTNIIIKTRTVGEATKYISDRRTGTISATTGYSQDITLQEDTEA